MGCLWPPLAAPAAPRHRQAKAGAHTRIRARGGLLPSDVGGGRRQWDPDLLGTDDLDLSVKRKVREVSCRKPRAPEPRASPPLARTRRVASGRGQCHLKSRWTTHSARCFGVTPGRTPRNLARGPAGASRSGEAAAGSVTEEFSVSGSASAVLFLQSHSLPRRTSAALAPGPGVGRDLESHCPPGDRGTGQNLGAVCCQPELQTLGPAGLCGQCHSCLPLIPPHSLHRLKPRLILNWPIQQVRPGFAAAGTGWGAQL